MPLAVCINFFGNFLLPWDIERIFIRVASVENASWGNAKCPIAVGTSCGLEKTMQTLYLHFPNLTASAPRCLHQFFCTFPLPWDLERNFIIVASVGNAIRRNSKCQIAVGRSLCPRKCNTNTVFTFSEAYCKCPKLFASIFCTFPLPWDLERNFVTVASVGNANWQNSNCPNAVGRSLLLPKWHKNTVFTFPEPYCKCPKLFASIFLHVSPPLGSREKLHNSWKPRECELTKPQVSHCGW